MIDYRFSVIVAADVLTDENILDATDALGNAGCTDALIRGHAEGMKLLFDRAASSLQSAISSAIADVERAGFRVNKLEMDVRRFQRDYTRYSDELARISDCSQISFSHVLVFADVILNDCYDGVPQPNHRFAFDTFPVDSDPA